MFFIKNRYCLPALLLMLPLSASANWYDAGGPYTTRGKNWETTGGIGNEQWAPGTQQDSCDDAIAKAEDRLESALKPGMQSISGKPSINDWDARIVEVGCAPSNPDNVDKPHLVNSSTFTYRWEIYSCNPTYPHVPFELVGACSAPEPLACTDREPYEGIVGPVWKSSNGYEANLDGCAWYDSGVTVCFNRDDGVHCSSTWIPYADANPSPPELVCDEAWGDCDDTGDPGGGDPDPGGPGNGGSDPGPGDGGGGDTGGGGSGTEIDYGRLGEAVGTGVANALTESGSSDPDVYFAGARPGYDEATGDALAAFDPLIDEVMSVVDGDDENANSNRLESATDLLDASSPFNALPQASCSNVVFGQGEVYEITIPCDKIEIFRDIFAWILYFWTFVTIFDLFTSTMRPKAQG